MRKKEREREGNKKVEILKNSSETKVMVESYHHLSSGWRYTDFFCNKVKLMSVLISKFICKKMVRNTPELFYREGG